MTEALRVYVWAVGNPVIVVPAPSRIIFCNQVDGTATEHRELEGFALPLPRLAARVFDPTWWRRRPGEIPRDVTVDRNAADNVEAWINVSFTFPKLDHDAEEIGTTQMKGVLTWENCD